MIGPFEIAVTLLVLGGVAGAMWVLSPLFRPPTSEAEPDLGPIQADWGHLRDLLALATDEHDAAEPWVDRAPLLAGGLRIPSPFRPVHAILAVVEPERAILLPLVDLLLEPSEPTGEPVLRGRSLGKAIHAVRLEGTLYLDLVSASRYLPVIGAELATLTSSTTVRRFEDLQDLLSQTGLQEDQVTLVAPWLVEAWESRVVPGGPGVRRFAFEFEGRELAVTAWMPAVARGVEAGRAAWAGIAELEGHREASVLDPEAAAGLGVERAGETWCWTADELLEMGAMGQRLDQDDLPLLGFIEEAFADRRVPVPDHEQGHLIAAAVLNWAGVIVRRSGLPMRAIGFFDAGLSVCGEGQEDNRADLLYNRGYARLHGLAGALVPTEHQRLQTFVFPENLDRSGLDAAMRDFTLASGLNPTDPDSWSQMALIHQLRGNPEQASEAWMQAATRSWDEEVKQTMLANARALAP